MDFIVEVIYVTLQWITVLCVTDFRGLTEKGGNVIDHCHGNKWISVHCMLERFGSVYVCVWLWNSESFSLCIWTLLLPCMCIQLCACESGGFEPCVHFRTYHISFCLQIFCRDPDAVICLSMTPTINQKHNQMSK